jgi:protein-disulfide isomerase/rhodanese-related sulfurtransferase
MRKSLLLALSLLGLFDSAYLWWVYASPASPMICLGGGTGCDTVRASSYSHLFGVPLPAFGVLMYVTLALLIFAEGLVADRLAELLRYAVTGISGAGFLFSLYLSGIEAFVVRAWCTWCLISAVSVTLIFALALLVTVQAEPPPEPQAALGLLRKYFAIFVAALVMGTPAFYFLVRSQALPPVPTASAQSLLERLVRPDSHVAGNPQAPVTVVEFADFQCVPCGTVEPTVRQIRAHYGNQIRFVFRHFPLPSIHPQAQEAAEATECAAEQGKFWEAAEKLYQDQADLREAALKRYAAELGLDTKRFAQCLESKTTAARVRRDAEDAHALGLRATPTFFIGHRIVEGSLEYAPFAQLVEQELALHGAVMAQAAAPSGNPSTTNGPPSQPRKKAASVAPPAAIGPTETGGGSTSLSGGLFTQFHTSALSCSEEEAAAEQPPLIRTAEARQFSEAGTKALFVDVRSASEFGAGHIPHAVNVPANEIEPRSSTLPKDNIIIYESGENPGDVCGMSRNVARYLLTHGFTPEHVKVYYDGLAGWEKAGLPVER